MSFNGCNGTTVVAGFDNSTNQTYMKPICLDITGIIGTTIGSYLTANIDTLIKTYLRTNVVSTVGNVLTGFDSITGNAVFAAMSSSQWVDGFASSISYPLGNVGIGTIGIPSERLEVVGNVAVSGNVRSAAPILPNHLTTMTYVDTQVKNICTSLG